MLSNSSNPHDIRVAVIGGGVSGLAAAHRVRQSLPQAELRLYEAGPRIGGPLLTVRRHGLVLEQGADSFTTKYPEGVELCRRAGLSDQLIPTNQANRRALVVRGGVLRPVPPGFVLMQPRNWRGVLTSPVLSIRAKLRMLAEPWIRVPTRAHSPGYDESVASFAARRLGREAFERLVEPLVAGIYVADAERLSLAATLPEFLDAERQHGSLWRGGQVLNNDKSSRATSRQAAGARYDAFLTPRQGMGELIQAVASSLPPGCVQLQTPVAEVSNSADGKWRVTTNDGMVEEYDGVILAAPAPQAARMVERLDPQLGMGLERIEYASSVVVTHLYRPRDIKRPLDGFGAVVPCIERRRLIAASFSSVKFPGRGSDTLMPIRAFMGGVLHPDIIDLADDQLASIAAREVGELLSIQSDPVDTLVARWPNAMPQYHVGHVHLVESIAHRAAKHPGLELAGSWYRGVGIAQCVRSGWQAADHIAAYLTHKIESAR